MRRLVVAVATAALLTAFPSALTTPGVALAGVAACDDFLGTVPGNYACTVPEGVDTLYFTVAGGEGGEAYDTLTEEGVDGGFGARITGSFGVSAGQVLDIVVGGSGGTGYDVGGGGGGASSIARDWLPIVVAGGGGGAGWSGGSGGNGSGGDAGLGGGYGGDAGEGMTGYGGSAGGRTGAGGDGGQSFLGYDGEGFPLYAYAGDGGTYDVGFGDGGSADLGSKAGGGGGAFGGLAGNGDGGSAAGGSPGAGGGGGYDGGGGGGGYGGGGGGGGGTGSGGGGGGGSSLVPSGATVEPAYAPGVTLSSTPPPDTTPPSIWLEQAAGQADPTKDGAINFALTASELVDTTTVSASDFTVTTGNGTIGTVSCSGTPTACTIPVTATARGVVTLAPSATFEVADPAGNTQPNAGYWDLSVTYLVPAANDDFADAEVLTGMSGSVGGTTTDATTEGSEEFWFTYTNSVWYRWTNSGRKDVEATFSLGDCTQSLRALDASAGPPDWYPTNWVAWGLTGGSCTGQTTMSFIARAGTTYWLQVAVPGSGNTGSFTLSWSTQAWTAVRGSLAVTLTNARGDATSCTITVKSVNLLAGRDFGVYTGDIQGEYIARVMFQTLGGRATYASLDVPASLWSIESGNELWISPATLLTSDGVTIATQKLVNRCHT